MNYESYLGKTILIRTDYRAYYIRIDYVSSVDGNIVRGYAVNDLNHLYKFEYDFSKETGKARYVARGEYVKSERSNEE